MAPLRRSDFAGPRGHRAPRQPALGISVNGSKPSLLEIERRRYEHGLHLLVSGQLEAVTAGQLEQECNRLASEELETIVLDLGDVTSMDPGGVGALFAVFARLGERLVVIVSPPCAHAIHLANARDRLPIIEG
ncbi:MAG TPA: STAS domain-containing protein [Solirubrobacteraceae bacterium]|jgi:anti-anti-sigma factor